MCLYCHNRYLHPPEILAHQNLQALMADAHALANNQIHTDEANLAAHEKGFHLSNMFRDTSQCPVAQTAIAQTQLPDMQSLTNQQEDIQMHGIPQQGETATPASTPTVLSQKEIELKKQLTECMLVGDNIDQKMVQKIWSGQYIDLAEFLNPDDMGVYDISYQKEDGKQGMVMQQRPKGAWETYEVIYLRHPSNRRKHQEMATYVHNLRDMRKKCLNWVKYDHRFRYERLKYGSTIPPWG